MRKVYLALLALGMTGMLAACGGSGNSGYVIKEGDSVLTEQFMQANYYQNKNVQSDITLEKYEVAAPDGYTLVTSSYSDYSYNRGYQTIKKNDKYGVYSFFGKKIIVDARLDNIPHYMNDRVFGFAMTYKDIDEHYYHVDGAGNVLMESKNTFYSVSQVNYDTRQDDKGNLILYSSFYYRLSTDDDYTTAYYKYDANNVATRITQGEYYYSEGKAGEYPVDESAIDMSEEGVNVLVRLNGSNYSGYRIFVLDKDSGEEKASFIFTSGNEGARAYQLGKRVYLQRKDVLNGKITLTTKYLDVEKLEMKSFDLPAEITSMKKLTSVENAEHKYAAVSLKEVYNDGTPGMGRTLIMDENGKFHDDITRKNFVSWLRLSSGYFYNQSNSELYDKEFTFVASTAGYSFDEASETFSQHFDSGAYVVLNNEGKVICDTANIMVQRPTPIFNKIFSVLQVSPYEQGYYNASTGKFFALTNTKPSEKTKIEVSESVDTDTYLVTRIEKTYPDDERSGSEIVAKRRGTVRTLDGQDIIGVGEKFGYANIGDLFIQNYGRDVARFYNVTYVANEVEHTVIAYNHLIKVSEVPAPAVTTAA